MIPVNPSTHRGGGCIHVVFGPFLKNPQAIHTGKFQLFVADAPMNKKNKSSNNFKIFGTSWDPIQTIRSKKITYGGLGIKIG